jgi:gliding motility-associated-like protein
MKYCLLLLSFLFIRDISWAQNIVGNASFEEYATCPYYYNQGEPLNCIGWASATRGTVDYYNSCNTFSIGRPVPYMGVPANDIGYQAAYDGNAYTGVHMGALGERPYREYLIAHIPPLQVDSVYAVTIHVSLADSAMYAADGMGVWFTTYGSPAPDCDTILVQAAQIDYTSYGVITETSKWVTLTDTFTADSAYTHFMIGGFKSTAATHIIEVDSTQKLLHGFAYYYIDKVEIIKVLLPAPPPPPPTPAHLLPDKHAIHDVITPNGDGINDTWVLDGIAAYPNNMVSVFDKWGDFVFSQTGYKNDWGGIGRKGVLPDGTYYYLLQLNAPTLSEEQNRHTGSLLIKR